MFRRLFTLILAVACACAPALAASAPAKHEASDCCCAGKCPCAPTDSTAPSAPSSGLAPAQPTTIERRAKGEKPAPRSTRADFPRFLFCTLALPSVPRISPSRESAPAAPIALFRAHCSLLI